MPPSGLLDARRAIAAFERIGVSSVVLTAGATAALTSVLTMCRLRASRPVMLCPRPHFPGYPGLATLCGFEVVFYPIAQDSDWVRQLCGLIRKNRPTAILINSPHNPTGTLTGKKELARLTACAQRQGAYLVLDESFAGVHPGGGAVPRLGLWPGLIRLGGFNKRFPCMADVRLGYVLAERSRAVEIAIMHRTLSLGISVAAQKALIPLLRDHPRTRLRTLSAEIWQHAEVAGAILSHCRHLRATPPMAGFFMIIRLPRTSDPADFARRLRARSGVWCAASPSFGVVDDQWIRLRLAVSRSQIVRHARAIVRLANERFGRVKNSQTRIL